MARYRGSTQEVHWLLSQDEVGLRRDKATSTRADSAQALSPDEEAIIRRHHERRILRFASRIGFPDKVAACAISYFKRYFLDRSVLDYNPSLIALSALYASFKVEEVLMSADDLVGRANSILNGVSEADIDVDKQGCPVGKHSADGTACIISSDDLLSSELSFLHALNFHLICYHPYRSLRVLESRLRKEQTLLTGGANEPSDTNEISESDLPISALMRLASRIVTRRTFLTDIQFTHSPAAVAMASIIAAAYELHQDAKVSDQEIDPKQIESMLLEDVDTEGHSVLEELVGQVRRMTEGGADDSTVRAIEQRRMILRNPMNDPASEEYKKMDKQRRAELDAKHREEALIGKEKRRRETAQLMGFDE